MASGSGRIGFTQETRRMYGELSPVKRLKPIVEDIPFVDGFPERLIREGLPGRLKRENVKIWMPVQRPLPRPPRKKVTQEPLPGKQLDRKSIKSPKIQIPTQHQNPEVFPVKDIAIPIPDKLSIPNPEKEARKKISEDQKSNQESVEDPVKNLEETFNQRTVKVETTNSTTIKELSTEGAITVPDSVVDAGLSNATRAKEEETITEIPVEPHFQFEEVAKEETITQSFVDVTTELRKPTNICILGLDRVGKYIAHSLAAMPHPPSVTLLIHRPYLLAQWYKQGSAIGVWRNGMLNVQSGINVELTQNYKFTDHEEQVGSWPTIREIEPPTGIIDNLMVTTGAHSTIPALRSISHRLNSSSTVCFLRDGGVGLIDEVNSKIFLDPKTRPKYAMASISHKISDTDHGFTVIEKAVGDVVCTNAPRELLSVVETEAGTRKGLTNQEKKLVWGVNQYSHMMRILTRAPNLHARSLNRQMFFEEVLDNTIINSIIGPLTVMFDCSNDQLLLNHNIRQVKEQLIDEISIIIRMMPEVSRHESKVHFRPQVISTRLRNVITKTGTNNSDMLKAVRKGDRTGIEFYNGYFVRRAGELGAPCPLNKMMLSLVQAKQMIISREQNAYIPLAGEN